MPPRLIDPERIAEIERTTHHDVIAFLSHVEEVVGGDARYLHLGLTSSDLLDTTFALQLREASDLLLAGIDRVLAALERRAREHQWTLCIGRTHGIHAEPTTFGVKLAGFYAEFARNRARLEQARAEGLDLRDLGRGRHVRQCRRRRSRRRSPTVSASCRSRSRPRSSRATGTPRSSPRSA